jgi:hypothetical protein
MKTLQHFIGTALILTLFKTAQAQTYVLTPTKDASIGFHDSYNSANTNYGNAIHYSGFSQPGASGGRKCRNGHYGI